MFTFFNLDVMLSGGCGGDLHEGHVWQNMRFSLHIPVHCGSFTLKSLCLSALWAFWDVLLDSFKFAFAKLPHWEAGVKLPLKHFKQLLPADTSLKSTAAPTPLIWGKSLCLCVHPHCFYWKIWIEIQPCVIHIKGLNDSKSHAIKLHLQVIFDLLLKWQH